jgi:hypothetical protein
MTMCITQPNIRWEEAFPFHLSLIWPNNIRFWRNKNSVMYKIIVSVLFIGILSACNQEHIDYFFTADQIKNHPTPEQVIKIMQREPDSAFNRLYFGKLRFIQLYYSEDSTEFRFKDGRLIEVIIHKPSIEYKPEKIEKFGLSYLEPDKQDTSAFFMWEKQYPGFDNINFYKIGSGEKGREVNYKIYFRLAPEE